MYRRSAISSLFRFGAWGLLRVLCRIHKARGPYRPLPEQVAALAAPNQDLATARLRPEDNCYWYMHSGPVEDTLLPLRTTRGNPICVKPAA